MEKYTEVGLPPTLKLTSGLKVMEANNPESDCIDLALRVQSKHSPARRANVGSWDRFINAFNSVVNMSEDWGVAVPPHLLPGPPAFSQCYLLFSMC